jgi:hypothetical protein
MSYDPFPHGQKLPAPCIVDAGILLNKQDMQRVLTDLNRVRYIYTQDCRITSQGEGCILEVFADPHRSTLVANGALYINVCSFDYLTLGRDVNQAPWFDLIQDDRQLRLIPLSNPLQEQNHHNLHVAALEAVVAEVLSASWDVQCNDWENQGDDEENLSF